MCSVAICKSQLKHRLPSSKCEEPIRFFAFPKDPDILRQWVINCHRRDSINPHTARVCSKHFTYEDFVDGLKAQLLNYPPRKLKKTAVPTVNITFKEYKEDKVMPECERKKIIEKLLANVDDDDDEDLEEGETKMMECLENDSFDIKNNETPNTVIPRVLVTIDSSTQTNEHGSTFSRFQEKFTLQSLPLDNYRNDELIRELQMKILSLEMEKNKFKQLLMDQCVRLEIQCRNLKAENRELRQILNQSGIDYHHREQDENS